MCETWSQHTWWLCSRPGLGAPKPGCDRSGIRGMLTVGRSLDRIGQPLSTYLCYSDYSYLFLLKTNVDFTLWNPVPKVTFRNRRPTLKDKKNHQNYFCKYLYELECLFLWHLPDLDLWLSVMGCGVVSTIAFTNTPRHKEKCLQNRPHRISPIKNGSIKLDLFIR
jgi:hypothetical protein